MILYNFTNMKKKKKIIFLSSLMTVSVMAAISITSCNTGQNDELVSWTLNEEVARLNNFTFLPKSSSFSIGTIINTSDELFLPTFIANWKPNNKFSYRIQKEREISTDIYRTTYFNIVVQDIITLEEKTTNSFNIKYEIQEEVDIRNKIKNINDNTKLLKSEFTDEEINNIDATNIINYLNIGINNQYIYQILDFNHNSNIKTFSLKVEIKNKEYESLISPQISNILTFTYTINNDLPITNSVAEEIARLNTLSPRLLNPNLTYQQLLDLNISNFLPLLTDFPLNNELFTYKVFAFSKTNLSNSKNINFNMHVFPKGHEDIKDDTNFTNNFIVDFILINEPEQDVNIDDQYLQNNLVDVITSGSYSLASPGSLVDNDCVKVSPGPLRTAPSAGVPEYAKSIQSKVFNELELDQLKNTFSLCFQSYSGACSYGTGWILDYKLTSDGSYPTTWYIATNAHVIQNLKIPNEIISPVRYEIENSPFANTNQLIMQRVKTESIQFGQDFGNSYNQDTYDRVDIPAANLKTIFIGLDYLTTRPDMFSKDGKWQNTEEYIDFAVMEVTFNSASEAKTFTQNYVEDNSRHFKYRKESILKNYNLKIDHGYSVIGFPDVSPTPHPYFRPVSMFSNRAAEMDKNTPIVPDDQFSNLASSPFYNTFNNRIGMFDASLGLSFFGMDYRQAYNFNRWYNSWGLTYPIDYSNLEAGSSGSMLRDKEGYTVGIYFASDRRASIGLAQALYCEGFNYQGKYGKFNLEGYDLIEGGFPNQKISYKDNLKLIYGDNYKTHLFPNGLK